MPNPDNTERRQPLRLEMAHVLFMDIVGYSKLPMDHQEAVLSTLKSVVSTAPEFLRAEASHEMIRLPTGDGMALVFFHDAESAARCALEVTRALKSHPEVPLRMGLHSGPVYRIADINANQNVAGGGINIAQRVMDCGDAGHILASQSVADVLGQLSSWKDRLHDLGEAEVKHGVRVHLWNLYTTEVGNAALPQKLHTAKKTTSAVRYEAKRKKLALATFVAVSLAAIAFLVIRGIYAGSALRPEDTIVLSDFENLTNDPVFDVALRQGLSSALQQTPFLNQLSDERLTDALKFMGLPAGAKLTPEVAWAVCQRTGSKAMLLGWIRPLGAQYLIALNAKDCTRGASLADITKQAERKEEVITVLGQAAADLRHKLGESLSSVQKFDVPLQEVTTPSIEALQFYAMGWRDRVSNGDDAAAIPLLQQAITKDPKFAMAYAALGTSYFNLGEARLGGENLQKAYNLRAPLSQWEKFYIESHYDFVYTGNLLKARQTYEAWAQMFPEDWLAPDNLGGIYRMLGQYDQRLQANLKACDLNPTGVTCGYTVYPYLNLYRLKDARAKADATRAKYDSPVLRYALYLLAFLENDAAGMEQQVAWSAGKPGIEDVLLSYEADSAAYSGQLAKSREISRRAVDSAVQAGQKETAAGYEAAASLREALFGNPAEARQRASAALALSNGRDVQFGAALAIALTGDTSRGQTTADDLGKRFSQDTLVLFNYLPTIRAQIAVSCNDSAKAIEALQDASSYELGSPVSGGGFSPALYPIYMRGQSYLALHKGNEAAAEFQKILDHPGVVLNEPLGPLAHLGLARAYVVQGDAAKAKSAYEDFFALWKNADPDVPVFGAAKAEYAKLK